jgi:hypothetical protein
VSGTLKHQRLRRSGYSDQARASKKLRRPTASLWATNQLAHADPKRLAVVIQGIGRVRTTQLRDPRGAMEALQRQRAELKGLVESAGERLNGEGYQLTPATARRISDTLLGASIDRRLAEDLRKRSGRVVAGTLPSIRSSAFCLFLPD